MFSMYPSARQRLGALGEYSCGCERQGCVQKKHMSERDKAGARSRANLVE